MLNENEDFNHLYWKNERHNIVCTGLVGPGCELTWNYSINLISKTNHLTIIRHIWNLEAFAAVSLIGPELYPKPLGAGGEGNGTFVRLTRLVGRHRVGESCEKHRGKALIRNY